MSDDDLPKWPSISDAELELLKQLWSLGEATVREVHRALEAAGRTWAYTTVQTMLHRLEEKGYVTVERGGFAHLFRAAVSRESLLGQRLDELADKLCGGASAPLVHRLVDRGRFSAEDIARFRRLLDDVEARGRRREGDR